VGALRYLAWCAIGLVGCLALSAGFAMLVDPYYVFGTPAVGGLNLRHPRANDLMIAARTHLAARMRPRTLLLGNSRMEVGFNPASPAWPIAMTPVFDAGLPGRDLAAARRVIEAALAGGRLQHIVVAVEFLDIMGDEGQGPPVPPIRRDIPDLRRWINNLRDEFEASLTIGVLADSIATMIGQSSHATNASRPDGSSDLGEYADYVRQHGGAALFEHKMAEYRARFATYRQPNFDDPEHDSTFGALLAILKVAKASGCTTDIIIYPYHAAVLDLMQKDGLWPSFEAFKRVLVQLVWRSYPGTRIVDFSGYNLYTTEPPPPDGVRQPMRWYWEPGHFRTSLGDQIVERLFNKKGDHDFGRDLRPDTVDAVLRATRHERDEAIANKSPSE
jgi:hypothetical protein